MNALQILVAYLCEAHNMQKKELAEKIGISPATLSQNLAKGKPSKKTFENLSRAFGISYEDLLRQYEDVGVVESAAQISQTKIRPHIDGTGIIDLPLLSNATNDNTDFPFNEDEAISAVVMFRGKYLYATTLKETKDIVQSIEAIKEMEKQGTDTAARAIQDLLVSKYEKR